MDSIRPRASRVKRPLTSSSGPPGAERFRPGDLVVTLPSVLAIPEHLWGTLATVGPLLTDGESNPKLAKSDAQGKNYRSFGLALAPAKESGYQVCASSSAGCREACLFFQGQARVFPNILVSRIMRTVLLFTSRDAFVRRLRSELDTIVRRGKAEGWTPAVRLNLTSDIMWERMFPDLMEQYSSVQFYDYTKHAERMLRFLRGQRPRNYSLCFSRSESNHADCLRVLQAKGNVVVVFESKHLPDRWEGYPVIDGDSHDLRFLDPHPAVVGVSAKGTAKQDESGFVVRTSGLLSLPVVD